MFADDCIIFYTVNKAVAQIVKNILENYWCVSGKQVNYNKWMVQLSKEKEKKMKISICDIL